MHPEIPNKNYALKDQHRQCQQMIRYPGMAFDAKT
jgi:hypothetical protein